MILSLKQALLALAAGKKLRMSSWGPGAYIQLTGGRLIAEDGGDAPFHAHKEYLLYDGKKHGRN